MQTYMFINTGVKMVFFKNAYGIKAKAHGQNPIGMMHNLLSLLMQTGRSPKTSACFSFPLSQLPSKIASPISAPRAYTLRDFLWKQSRNSKACCNGKPGGCLRAGRPREPNHFIPCFWFESSAFLFLYIIDWNFNKFAVLIFSL